MLSNGPVVKMPKGAINASHGPERAGPAMATKWRPWRRREHRRSQFHHDRSGMGRCARRRGWRRAAERRPCRRGRRDRSLRHHAGQVRRARCNRQPLFPNVNFVPDPIITHALNGGPSDNPLFVGSHGGTLRITVTPCGICTAPSSLMAWDPTLIPIRAVAATARSRRSPNHHRRQWTGHEPRLVRAGREELRAACVRGWGSATLRFRRRCCGGSECRSAPRSVRPRLPARGGSCRCGGDPRRGNRPSS